MAEQEVPFAAIVLNGEAICTNRADGSQRLLAQGDFLCEGRLVTRTRALEDVVGTSTGSFLTFTYERLVDGLATGGSATLAMKFLKSAGNAGLRDLRSEILLITDERRNSLESKPPDLSSLKKSGGRIPRRKSTGEMRSPRDDISVASQDSMAASSGSATKQVVPPRVASG